MKKYLGIEYKISLKDRRVYVRLPDYHPFIMYFREEEDENGEKHGTGYKYLNRLKGIFIPRDGFSFFEKITDDNRDKFWGGLRFGYWIGWKYIVPENTFFPGGTNVYREYVYEEAERECKAVICDILIYGLPDNPFEEVEQVLNEPKKKHLFKVALWSKGKWGPTLVFDSLKDIAEYMRRPKTRKIGG